ncbi:MAG: OmpA family protein [Methylococcaceae bacterium]|nr:OmpA family protein [Methylococcaceae bacterium]
MTGLKVLLLILFLTNSVSCADFFSAPLPQADWEIKKDSSSCQLIQKIPLYGEAYFMHQSGELLRFSIRENRFKPEIVKASLTIDPSPWSHQSIAVKDHLVYLDQGIGIQNYPRLSVYGETAETMLDALVNGLYPTFAYVRASVSDLLPETRVAISAVNFLKKYEQFAKCRQNFLPSGIKDLLEKSLFFKSGSNLLNAGVVKQLKDTVRFVKEVKGSRVVIVSDTAMAGKQDKRWFTKRAAAIANKLKSLGVPKNKVSIKNGIQTAEKNHKIIQLSVFGPDALRAIYYRKGNVSLTQTEKQRLELLVRYAEEFQPNSQLVIKSHTDSKGSRANNLKVSQKRGDEIKRYLVSKGMDEKKVRVKAYGESRPAKSNRFPTGRSQNRRAIIDFVG